LRFAYDFLRWYVAGMARSLAEIQVEIHELSVADKEALLRCLWEDLDGEPDSAVEAASLEEAQRRDRELDEGVVESVPAGEVFARLEAAEMKPR